jgi:hypothetical protein
MPNYRKILDLRVSRPQLSEQQTVKMSSMYVDGGISHAIF